jgi:hypothetical protein
MIRRKQESSSEDKTADDMTVADRCAIPREIYNDIAVIASASKNIAVKR